MNPVLEAFAVRQMENELAIVNEARVFGNGL